MKIEIDEEPIQINPIKDRWYKVAFNKEHKLAIVGIEYIMVISSMRSNEYYLFFSERSIIKPSVITYLDNNLLLIGDTNGACYIYSLNLNKIIYYEKLLRAYGTLTDFYKSQSSYLTFSNPHKELEEIQDSLLISTLASNFLGSSIITLEKNIIP